MFENPEILWYLWAVPVLTMLYLLWGRGVMVARIKLASKDTRAAVIRAEPGFIRFIRVVLILLALSLFIIALARPLGGVEYVDIEVKGIDIVLAVDISKSMLARDFTPSRLEYLKRQAKTFVRASKGDRFAIVAFAGQAYIHMPMTSDIQTVLTFIDRLEINPEIKQGTAIGDAIQTAVERFVGGEDNAKVVLLFTDGESNKGIDPLKASRDAAKKGVVIFPVGIGSVEGTYIPEVMDLFGQVRYKTDQQGRRVLAKLDEDTLIKIASSTGATYFSAADPKQWMGIYTQIDRSVLQTYQNRRIDRSTELAPLFLVAGLILLFMEAGLHYLTPPGTPRRSGHYAFEK
jgi:Ca-activated chloride channel family protein